MDLKKSLLLLLAMPLLFVGCGEFDDDSDDGDATFVTISGTADDGSASSPLARARCELIDISGTLVDSLIANGDGSFRFSVQPDLRAFVHCAAEDRPNLLLRRYISTVGQGSALTDQDVTPGSSLIADLIAAALDVDGDGQLDDEIDLGAIDQQAQQRNDEAERIQSALRGDDAEALNSAREANADLAVQVEAATELFNALLDEQSEALSGADFASALEDLLEDGALNGDAQAELIQAVGETVDQAVEAIEQAIEGQTGEAIALADAAEATRNEVGGATDLNAPVATNDSATTAEESPVTVAVLNNDSDAEGSDLTVAVVIAPTNGSATSDGSRVTYTPNADFNGSDSFTYRATDRTDLSARAVVTVSVTPVNDAPVVVADGATTDEDVAVTVNVLDNDSDIDGDTLSVALVDAPANGSVTTDDTTITYTPNSDFNGSDSFTYRAVDAGGLESDTPATVTLTINPINDAPVAADDEATTDEEVAVTVAVLDNDSDVDGDSLTLSVVTFPTHGGVSSDGTSLTYIPETDFFGNDSLSYQLTDSSGLTSADVAVVTLTVDPINDPPALAPIEAQQVEENGRLVVGLVASDVDHDTADLTLSASSSDPTLIPIEQIRFEPPAVESGSDRQRVTAIEFLGEVLFTTPVSFQEMEVGGLSALAYDAENSVFYALSDGRSSDEKGPARFYTLNIPLSPAGLEVEIIGVTPLLDQEGVEFANSALDPEGMAVVGNQLYIASERDLDGNPWIRRFDIATGMQSGELTVPDRYRVGDGVGTRSNLGFEALTVTPDGRYLLAGMEGALVQDGPEATLDNESLARVLRYDLGAADPNPIGEFVYITDPVIDAPNPDDAFTVNGLVELLALDNAGTLLALERSFSVGAPRAGNNIRLFEASSGGALDTNSLDDLFREDEIEDDGEILPPGPFEIDPPAEKSELLNLAEPIEAGDFATEYNVEGLTFGPDLPDGRRTLIMVSDNNFDSAFPEAEFQFLAFAIALETSPAANPRYETPSAHDTEMVDAGVLAGDLDDPAIWVHPSDPAESRILGTLKDGGLALFNLKGEHLQSISQGAFGEFRYNNVDLLYGFDLDGVATDLAVVTDRGNDTLTIFAIDPVSGELSDVTGSELSDAAYSIFGEDDGEHTGYGLGTYHDRASDRFYAFVSQRDGDRIAQLELSDDGNGGVTAQTVRTLPFPIGDGDPEDFQSEGVVIDQELGFLYVSIEDEIGVLKYDADPESGTEPLATLIDIDDPRLKPDLEGMTIYYGANGSGYLILSSQGNHTYALFDRAGDNAFLGTFSVGEHNGIDQANETDGLDVSNLYLGPDFPFGLLVVQDGANDPQRVAEDDEELENQSTSFKLVPWEAVAQRFMPPLSMDISSYHPRGNEVERVNQVAIIEPAEDQVGGPVDITLTVSDGELTSSRSVAVEIEAAP